MTVYLLDFDVERYQSLLPVKDSVWDRKDLRFLGGSIKKRWKPFDVFSLEPKLKEGDFFYFDPGAFILTDDAYAQTATPLEMSGELLPVPCPKKKTSLWLYNVTHCIDVLDEERSVYEYPRDPEYKGDVVKYVFHKDRLGDHSLFKLANVPVDIFCLERTGDPADEEFKALVQQAGLKGLTFKKVWSDQPRRPKPISKKTK